jgi:AcrR family transcriptional regulator
MPKRSQEYRDARREEILSAAKRCFVRNGFHETSMQDLFAEVGLSSGAVYRYFASKDDVILAIVEANLGDVVELIQGFSGDPKRGGLGATLDSVFRTIREKDRDASLGALALLAWAEVLRNPTLRARFEASLTQMRQDLALVVADRQHDGVLPTSVSSDDIAGLILAIVPGFILQLALLGDPAVDGLGEAARALWPS